MTAQHTPGPYRYRREERLIVTDGDGMMNKLHIAMLCSQAEDTDANGSLLAAAPLMLEALKRYAHDAETFSDGVSGLLFSDLVGDTHTAALAAIRAATGEDA